jgi:hypothetical protein
MDMSYRLLRGIVAVDYDLDALRFMFDERAPMVGVGRRTAALPRVSRDVRGLGFPRKREQGAIPVDPVLRREVGRGP